LHSFRNNNNNSKFAGHLLTNGHFCGKINDVMEMLRLSRKGTHVDTKEKLYVCIYSERIKGNELNYKHIFPKSNLRNSPKKGTSFDEVFLPILPSPVRIHTAVGMFVTAHTPA
jgi:hypothetical protein